MSIMSRADVERLAESYVPVFASDLKAAGFTDQQSKQFALATQKFVSAVLAQVMDEVEHLPASEYRVN